MVVAPLAGVTVGTLINCHGIVELGGSLVPPSKLTTEDRGTVH